MNTTKDSESTKFKITTHKPFVAFVCSFEIAAEIKMRIPKICHPRML